VADTKNDAVKALGGEKSELALDERLAGHLHHRLGYGQRLSSKSRPEATGKYCALHG